MTPEAQAALDGAVAAATSAGENDDTYWSAVRKLYAFGTREVFDEVASWSSSLDPRLRELVPDVLRFLGGAPFESGQVSPRPFRDESIAIFTRMVEQERDPSVLAAIGFANCDLSDPRMAEVMLPFRAHGSPEVRLSVVHALMNATSAEARTGMIALTADADDDVRNWATFALATSRTDAGNALLDGPDIHAALWARRDDSHSETRAEAALGLAERGDSRVIAWVERGLAEGEWDHYAEAAQFLGLTKQP